MPPGFKNYIATADGSLPPRSSNKHTWLIFVLIAAVILMAGLWALCKFTTIFSDQSAYYQDLAKQCESKASQSCCMASVKVMEAGNFKLPENNVCPEGFLPNMMRCIDSFKWCEPTNNPTADWQTYRNEEYGFEFKYPRDWSEYPGSIDNMFIFGIGGPNDWQFQIEISSMPVLNQTQISICSKIIYQAKEANECTGVEYRYTEIHNQNLYYLISWHGPEYTKNKDLFDQILSTFKFID